MDLEGVNFAVLTFLFAPLTILLSTVIFLAAVGQSLGIRYVYMKILLFLFDVSFSIYKYHILYPYFFSRPLGF